MDLSTWEMGDMGAGVQERLALLGPPRTPQFLSQLYLCFQGNNIMLVASQPALQGPEKKSYEIAFREVRTCRPPPHSLLASPDPGRHGGVWGEWGWGSPVVAYSPMPLTHSHHYLTPRNSGAGLTGSQPHGSTC